MAFTATAVLDKMEQEEEEDNAPSYNFPKMGFIISQTSLWW